MINVESFSGDRASVSLTFYHACDHHDYTRTVLMPVELANDDTFTVTCPADGMTMMVVVSVNGLVNA